MEGNGKSETATSFKELIDAVREVRDELKHVRGEAEKTNAKLDQTNARLDQTREELIACIETTNAKTREDLGGRIDGVREDLGSRIDGVRLEVVALRAMARADERDDHELRGRVERLEQHLGLAR